MAAPAGNDYKLKYKTPEKRKALCERYCAYLKKGGYPSYFSECSDKTIDAYREKYPEDFPTEMLEEAEREYKRFYFDLLTEGATGKIHGYNAPSAIFLAKNINKFRDNHDITSGGKEIKSAPPQIIVTDAESASIIKRIMCGEDEPAASD